MSEDFELNERNATFDFQGFLIRIVNHWPLFLVSLVIAFSIAYYVNVRKLPVYLIENMVAIKDDQNPFFTSNTSLTFNWGGTTDKVNTSMITFKSRSHNEKVVEELQYYLTYLKDGKYQQVDAYKQTPFMVVADTDNWQMLNHQIKVVFKDSVNFNLTVAFEEEKTVTFQNYSSKEKMTRFFEAGNYSENYQIGQHIVSPLFNGVFMPNPKVVGKPNTPYYLVFRDFDATVRNYLSIRVTGESRGSSVLKLGLTGTNKQKLVDYLNTSVDVLSKNMLDRKNLFATKTIKFIDSTLAVKSQELSDVESELNAFKNRTAIFDLEREGSEISSRLAQLDLQREAVNNEINYYDILEDYLVTRKDYRNAPAPSVAGITEPSITASVGKIVALSEERNKLQYSFKDDAPIFDDIDRQINAIKTVLLENIRSSKDLINGELRNIDKSISRYEGEIRRLPKEQQGLLKIERRYNLSQGSYNLFLEKKSEAGLVKAANISDVLVIDDAKDTGGGQIGPNTQLNYVMAGLFGMFIPLLIVFIRVFFDTKVRDVAELEKITSIPLLGVVGKNPSDSVFAVMEMPKSAISEAFRNLRSSLQFLYKKQGIKGAKTVLITSSVSAEGKTFCSINLASVFALSDKKTVILDLDLRKPKLAKYFGFSNTTGVVNYLINEAQLEDIIQSTDFPNLDVITSGPNPPNPSELLIGERLEHLLESLKEKYDYIVLDSPPLGLVTDSLELTKHVDATLYIARFNYTKKNMFNLVNEKYRRGEVKHISVVLNGYNEKSGYGYGYGYGYGNYNNGYHENVKRKSIWKRMKVKKKKY